MAALPDNASRARRLGAVSVAVAALLAGCDLELQPGAEGIFQAVAPPTPTEAAVWAIDPYDANKRYRGLTLLANAPFGGEPVYLALYVDNTDDPDPSVRAAAVRALSNHGGPSHAPLLAERLDDEDPLVRLEAARALQRIHNPEVVDALLRHLPEYDLGDPVHDIAASGETDASVRAEVARALGQYAQNRVVLALIGALADRELPVNRNAQDSLRFLTGQDFGFDRRAWQEWYNSAEDPFAARGVYTYPVFARPKKLIEYLPFVPGPPNETPAPPAGYPRLGMEPAAAGRG